MYIYILLYIIYTLSCIAIYTQVGKAEVITSEEKKEMAVFLHHLCATPVMVFLLHYLQVRSADDASTPVADHSDKDLYCFSGSCTKFTYLCSARQIIMSFFSRISRLDSMAKSAEIITVGHALI